MNKILCSIVLFLCAVVPTINGFSAAAPRVGGVNGGACVIYPWVLLSFQLLQFVCTSHPFHLSPGGC